MLFFFLCLCDGVLFLCDDVLFLSDAVLFLCGAGFGCIVRVSRLGVWCVEICLLSQFGRVVCRDLGAWCVVVWLRSDSRFGVVIAWRASVRWQFKGVLILHSGFFMFMFVVNLCSHSEWHCDDWTLSRNSTFDKSSEGVCASKL